MSLPPAARCFLRLLIGRGWEMYGKACHRRRRSYADLGALQDWLTQDHRAPALVVLPCLANIAASEDMVSAAHQATRQVLGVLQGVLGDQRLAHSRVVVVTRRAVATHAGEDVLDCFWAPLWGGWRSAQSEHPGRLALLDIDTLPVSEAAWQCALGSEEPQLGLRLDKLCAPRLVRERVAAQSNTASEATRALDPAGTVLITGGTGTLDGLVARHLIAEHGFSIYSCAPAAAVWKLCSRSLRRRGRVSGLLPAT